MLNAERWNTKTVGYQLHIEGLRSIAAIAVIFFHLKLPGFSGGFIGVDIFFVISGYLITAHILNELRKESHFSLRNFYVKRIRRLFPSLASTVIISFIVAAFIFSPEDLISVSSSAIAALFSVSNILFWSQTGYFDSESYVKPLLHTWTLSIEAQYYLLYPIVLSAAYKIFTSFGIPIVVSLIVFLSFTLTIIFQFVVPSEQLIFGRDIFSTMFYWLPFRLFEFGIGGLLALAGGRIKPNQLLSEILCICGLILIGYSIIWFDGNTVVPGILALVPLVGTALVITSVKSVLAGAVLKNSVATHLGRISYSLYLVHWPIIVFYYYIKTSEVSFVENTLLILLIYVAAFAQYHLIENRFRKPQKNFTIKGFPADLMSFSAIIFLTTCISAHAFLNSGWTWRLNEPMRSIVEKYQLLEDDKARKEERALLSDLWTGNFSDPNSTMNILFVGDSHSQDMYRAVHSVRENFATDIDMKLYPIRARCQVHAKKDRYFPERRTGDHLRCRQKFLRLQKSKILKQADYVFLPPRWFEDGVENLDDTIQRIKRNTKAEIVVFARVAEWEHVPKQIIARGSTDDLDRFMFENRIIREDLNRELASVAKKHNIRFINTPEITCNTVSNCAAIDSENNLLFQDYGHWTAAGARYFGQLLLEGKAFDFLKR